MSKDTGVDAQRNTVGATGESGRVEAEAATTGQSSGGAMAVLRSSAGRNLGLVVALAIICVVGTVTAGDRFASIDNVLTILKLASVIGVVSIGMTFVITGGGIDLSVGAIVALSSVWCTTLATQTMAEDTHWIVMVLAALAVGAGCGLVNGVLIAYGNIVSFIATLAMLASARGLAELISDRKTQIVRIEGFKDFFGAEVLGIPVLVIIFALVAALG
jgi:ribose transport system permease protein